jgi:ribosome-associated protein
MRHEVNPRLDLFVQAALGRKAEGIVVLDVHELTSIADTFIICSGRSNRQVSAIAEHIERFLKEHKIRALSVDGKKEGHWVLMDYGDIIIHVFYEETRSFYDLEGLWVDAARITTESMNASDEKDRRSFDGEEIFVE